MAAGGQESTEAPAGAVDAGASVLAVLGLLALALCVVLAVLSLSSRRSEVDRAEATTAAERRAGTVAVLLRDVEAAVEQADPACGGIDDATGTLMVRCVPPDATTLDDPPPGVPADLLADPAVRTAEVQARDRGVAVLSAPTSGAAPTAVVVAAWYATGPAGDERSRQPDERSIGARRDTLAHYVVAVLDPAALLGTLDGWQLADAGTTLAGDARLDGSSVDAELAAFDRRWTVSTTVRDTGPWRPGLLAVALLGLLAAALLGLADRRRRRMAVEQAVLARRSARRADAIRTLAGVVQRSRDLDETLPGLAVQLADELDLAGFSLAVATGGAGEREVFVHGTPPDRGVRPVPGRSGPLPAGQTLALDLRRAERSIAVLRVRADRALSPEETDVVDVAAELITSTIVAVRSIEQQQEAVDRLEALDELKTAFLGLASHELRTPATAIAGLASLLAERWDELGEQDRRVFAQRIATNADALNVLVQDLLDFARLERGDIALALAPVDLSAAVEVVLERLDTVWGSHGVERRLDPDVWVWGDVNAIERIVTNLVSNAVKFSPEGESVTVTVAHAAGRARLVVDDAGPGVPPDEREKIFVRFFRGSGDAVVRTRGVGIGLSVVQDFVTQMGGDVRVEESPEGGARFVVELPVHDRRREEERDAAST